MKRQRLYRGVRFPMGGPSPINIGKIDSGAIPMILHMQKVGLQVDLGHFATMERVLIDDMERLTEEVHDVTGYYLNLASSPQVSDLLFKKLGLKQAHIRLTKSGDRESVEDEVLTAIQHEHPVVPKLLDYKEIDKLRGTYVAPMQKLATRTSLGTYRLYPNFTTTRIPSGRLSCKSPNLLAMPNRTSRGRQICEGFITNDGWVYLSVDESQIEPRVVAHRSQDAALMRIYENEEDIYSDFATQAFNLKDQRYHDETGWHYPGIDKKLHRFPAKTCILSAIYRITAGGLLEKMPILCANCMRPTTADKPGDVIHTCAKFRAYWTEEKCQDILNSFYMKYPGIIKMWKQDDKNARKYAYLWDDFGRLLHLQAVRSVHEWVVSSALREGGNFPIQSCAQGTIKLTMAAVMDDLEEAGVLGEIVNPLLQVHDELLFECRADYAEEIGALVQHRFETCVQLRVPIQAGIAQAPNWGSLPK